jgi:enamine deaminase RidA (YjgF/YER057c/UK114 family)
MDRRRISTGTEWEPRVGYSRAVRVGDRVLVSGTTATDEDGEPVHPGDPYAQAAHAIEIVEEALDAAGASLADVVRTRMYVADADDWGAVGDAHAEAFGDVRPAATMVEVSRLIGPEYLVEIEAEAVIGGGDGAENGNRDLG